MAEIRCPRCDAVNVVRREGDACDRCGEKLPAPDAIGTEPTEARADVPRGRPLDDIPAYLDVRKRDDRREEKWKKAASEVSGILIAIALLTLVCNGFRLFAVVGPRALAVPWFHVALVLGLVMVFAGLAVWARWVPVPAGIIGVILYGALAAFEVYSVTAVGGGFPYGIVVKAFIIIGLIRGIHAAMKAGDGGGEPA